MPNSKNIILLSEKSSGSSACQNLLTRFADVRHVAKTRHYQNETLFWTKAASVLGKPQLKMVDSEVPIAPERARADLVTLLTENLDNYQPPAADKELIDQGWNLLCKQYAPIFLEKSPHHLCQWSALELIVEHIRQVDDVDFLLLGLVRNPMDTIYSQFKRWKSPPEKVEKQWVTAYQNLLRLQETKGVKLVIVRYEDIVASLQSLRPVFDFCGVEAKVGDEDYLHQQSLSKWKQDKLFGFTLSAEGMELAKHYGYEETEVLNQGHPLWGIYSKSSRAVNLALKPIKQLARKAKKRLRNPGQS